MVVLQSGLQQHYDVESVASAADVALEEVKSSCVAAIEEVEVVVVQVSHQVEREAYQSLLAYLCPLVAYHSRQQQYEVEGLEVGVGDSKALDPLQREV